MTRVVNAAIEGRYGDHRCQMSFRYLAPGRGGGGGKEEEEEEAPRICKRRKFLYPTRLAPAGF